MKFTKMQGLGNDYIYVNTMEEKVGNPGELAVKISDRHFGIGADGLILINCSDNADFKMEMYNADGSRGTMCGNGIRCVAKYVYDKKMTDKKNIRIETLSGIKETIILSEEEKGADFSDTMVRVNMGRPYIEKAENLVSVGGHWYDTDYISMGNPHTVVHLNKVEELDLEQVGPVFESHRGNGYRTNTEFIRVPDRNTIEMRVWERGSGETLACGTGACASVVSSILRNLTEREVRIKLLGGDLLVKWSETDGNVYMTGPAVTVFEGEMNI